MYINQATAGIHLRLIYR